MVQGRTHLLETRELIIFQTDTDYSEGEYGIVFSISGPGEHFLYFCNLEGF